MRQTASDYPSPLKEEIVWTADRRYDPIATSLPLDSFDVDLRSYLLSTPGSQLVSTNSLGQLNRFHCKNLDTAVRSKALASPISYSLQDEVYFSESAQVLLSDGTVGEVVKVMKLLDSDDPQAVQKAKEIMFGGLVKVERVPWRPKAGALFGEGTSYLATSALAPKEYHKDTPFSNIALFAASRGRCASPSSFLIRFSQLISLEMTGSSPSSSLLTSAAPLPRPPLPLTSTPNPLHPPSIYCLRSLTRKGFPHSSTALSSSQLSLQSTALVHSSSLGTVLTWISG